MGRKPPPSKSLAYVAPTVAAELHPTLNGDLTAWDVWPGSDLRLWWLCSNCGHPWQTKVHKRVSQNQGCSKCAASHRAEDVARPRRGESLAEEAPEIAKEWHPELNGDLTPFDVRTGSGKIVWWRCSRCPHEWKTNVYSRGKRGSGCQKCAAVRRGVLRATPKPGNSFADRYPDAAREWHPYRNGALKPTGVRPASRKRVWWQCKFGHEWQVCPADRQRGERCRFCAEETRPRTKRTPKPGQSLLDLFPDVAKDWHPTLNEPFTAADVNPGSKSGRWWLCHVCKYVWSTTPDKRTLRGDGCRKCSPVGVSARQIRLAHEIAAVGFNVDHAHPPITVQGRQPVRADIVIPDLQLVIEYDGVRFHADLAERDRRQSEALESAGWSVIRVREEKLPSLGGREVFVSPWEPIKTVALAVLELMEQHGWVAPKVAEYRVDPAPWGEDGAKTEIYKHRTVSLASENPRLAAEIDPQKNGGITADQIPPRGTRTKFVWTCSGCSNDWSTTVSLRADGHGCPVCGYQLVSQKLSQPKPGESLADLFPDIAKQFHPTKNDGVSPRNVHPGSQTKYWWKCEECENEWPAPVWVRTAGHKCPDCAGREGALKRGMPAPGESFADLFPEEAANWHLRRNKITPLQVKPTSTREVWWKCKQGHEWPAKVCARRMAGRCPVCRS